MVDQSVIIYNKMTQVTKNWNQIVTDLRLFGELSQSIASG